MHSVVYLPLLVAALLLVSSPAHSLWETHNGSDSRPGHCDPIPDPYWSPPGLTWLHSKGGDSPRAVDGVWIIPAAGLEWAAGSKRVLVTVDGRYASLDHHNETFQSVLSTRMPGVRPSVELMDHDQDGIPGMMVALQRTLYDLQGEPVQVYPYDTLLLQDFGPHMWPAMGDLTGDGSMIFVNGGESEWQAHSTNGELIARRIVVDEKDSMGWYSTRAHREEGQEFVYIVTRNEYPEDLDLYKRLHKVRLTPTPAATFPGPGASAAEGPLQEVVLPYEFETLWMREFHGNALDDELRFYDLDGDGRDEIVLSHGWHPHSETGSFTILDLDGNIRFEHPLKKGGRVAVGDTNGNGVDEIVVLTHRLTEGTQPFAAYPEATLSAVEWDGAQFVEVLRFEASDEYGGRFLVLCDVDGDGADEIFIALGEPLRVQNEQGSPVGEGWVKLFRSDGTLLWEFKSYFGHIWRGLIIDDFTGDGAYEFIITTKVGQVLVFSPFVEPSPSDHQRVFDELLARGVNTPTEAQVARWMDEVHARYETDPLATEPPEVSSGSGLLHGMLLAALATLVAFTARRRGRSPLQGR